jgi:Spy/CpxP family protein refolding chaperone
MNKKILLSSVIILSALLLFNTSYAVEKQAVKQDSAKAVTVQKDDVQLQRKLPPPEFKHGNFEMKPPFHSKEEMEAKKAEIDKRLNLTEEQKKQIEKNKEKDRKKIKPVIDKMHADKKELHEIYGNDTLTRAEKDKKAKKIKKDLKKQKNLADKYRKENMKNFESVLTTEQKEEFAKIKQEQKAEMEKRKAEFEQNRKEFCEKKHGFHGMKPPFEAKPLVQPPPPKETK